VTSRDDYVVPLSRDLKHLVILKVFDFVNSKFHGLLKNVRYALNQSVFKKLLTDAKIAQYTQRSRKIESYKKYSMSLFLFRIKNLQN